MGEIEGAKSAYSPESPRRYTGPIPSSEMQLLPGGFTIAGRPDLMGLHKAMQADLDREDKKRYEETDRKWEATQRARDVENWSYTDWERREKARRDEIGQRREDEEWKWKGEDREAKAKKEAREWQAAQDKQSLEGLLGLPKLMKDARDIGMPELAQAAAKRYGYEGPLPQRPSVPPPVPSTKGLEMLAPQMGIPKEIVDAYPQDVAELQNIASLFLNDVAGPAQAVLDSPFATQSDKLEASNKIGAAKHTLWNNYIKPFFTSHGITARQVPYDPKTDPYLIRLEEAEKIRKRHRRHPAVEKAFNAVFGGDKK